MKKYIIIAIILLIAGFIAGKLIDEPTPDQDYRLRRGLGGVGYAE